MVGKRNQDCKRRYFTHSHFHFKILIFAGFYINKLVNHTDEKSNEKHNDKSNKSKSNKHILHLRNKTQKDIPKIKVDTEFLVHKAQENKSRERELNDNESESDLEGKYLLNIK